MKQIERNLLTSATVAIEDVEYMIKLIEEQPERSINIQRRESANQKIGIGMAFIKALKMITCTHNTKLGSSTGVAYIKDYKYENGEKIIIRSIREVTRRCHNCNQVFHRKKTNLRKKNK